MKVVYEIDETETYEHREMLKVAFGCRWCVKTKKWYADSQNTAQAAKSYVFWFDKFRRRLLTADPANDALAGWAEFHTANYRDNLTLDEIKNLLSEFFLQRNYDALLAKYPPSPVPIKNLKLKK